MALDDRIRTLSEDNWEEFRRVRLCALQSHPHYFLWSFEKAAAEPESFWREILSKPRQQIFGLYDDMLIIGITGVFTHRDYPDGKTADFGMSFIEPAHRGQKLSRLFYQARIAWARENGFARIIVGHHADNAASKNANQRFGFIYMGQHMRDWPDGSRAVEVEYELKL